MGILVFLKGIIPHIIELKQSKCRVGYGELLLWPARKPKGVGVRVKGKVAFSYTLWLPRPWKRGISSKENESPVTGPGLDVQIQVWRGLWSWRREIKAGPAAKRQQVLSVAGVRDGCMCRSDEEVVVRGLRGAKVGTDTDDLDAVDELLAERRVGDVLVGRAVGLEDELRLVTEAHDGGVERGGDSYG